MDWKNIIKNIIGFLLLLTVIIGANLYQNPINTSYEEVLSDLIGENENVEKIAVYTGSRLLNQKATVIIEDQDLINDILHMDIELEKRRGKHAKELKDALIIKTNKDSYVVGLDLLTLTIGVNEYRTVNSLNPIFKLIEEEDFEWEIGEFTFVNSETGEFTPIFPEKIKTP